MNGESGSTSERGRMTRRGLLAAAGTSVLAGCSGLAELDGGEEPTILAHELRVVDPDEDPEPVVPESVPVDVAPEYFDAARARVTGLLAELPTPLGPADVPNGYVREQLSEAAADATAGLDDARDAPTELVALQSLRRARAEARYAAAGWAVADRGLSVEAVRREHEQVVSDARSVRDAHEYVGADRVRAALVHARIEDALARAVESDARSREGSRLLSVAEWGETAESARAVLDDARHLDERFAASLPDDAGTVGEPLAGTAETLLAEVRSRGSELPPEPTAEEWGLPEHAVDDLRWEAADGVARLGDANGPASAVVGANGRLTQFRALERLQERVDDGELSRPESADAVRELRSTAHEVLETALAESPVPELTRTAITRAAWRVAGADWRLAHHEGEVAVSRLDREVADYVVATAVGRAAPDVSRRTAETLRGA